MRRKKSALARAAAVATAIILFGNSPVFGVGFYVASRSGDPLPDNSGAAFTLFGTPALNNRGELAFTADASMTGSASFSSVIQTDGVMISLIAREGDPTGSPDTTFAKFDQPTQSNAGYVAFFADIVDANTGNQQALYRGGAGGLLEIARTGDVPPDFGQPITDFGRNANFGPTLNDSGEVGFLVNRSRILDAAYVQRTTGLSLLAKEAAGNTDVGVREVSDLFAHSPSINNSGQAALGAFIRHSAFNSYNVLRDDPSAGLTVALECGDTNTNGNLILETGHGPSFPINEVGQIAIEGFIRGITNSERIIVLTPDPQGQAPDTQTLIAYYGEPAPDSVEGMAQTYAVDPRANFSLNDAGQVLFPISFRNQTTYTGGGIFIGDGSATTMLAMNGQTAPNGNGTFASLDTFSSSTYDQSFALNNAGQAVFATGIDTGSGHEDTPILCFWDPDAGLREILRRGDHFLGSTIQSFEFSAGNNENATERSGLNDSGEVAFQYHLADGREGVAIWSAGFVPILGDANHDGSVSSDDFTILSTQFGQSTALDWSAGDIVADFNGDGVINALDFNAIATNFGNTAIASAFLTSQTVPEPPVVGGVMMLAMVLGRYGRLRRRS